MAYFDHNATTPLSPAARAAWLEAPWYNPSSPYRAAMRARLALDEAREAVAGLIGGAPEQVVFTSGATEANNALFRAFARGAAPDDTVVISALEHPSVAEAAEACFPGRVERLPAGPDGVTRLDALAERLKQPRRPRLLSLLAGHNETGVHQPWREAAALAREAGVPFHTDAAQWIGKEPLDGLEQMDYVTGSAHKLGGPAGVGFLRTARGGVDLRAQAGGAQEQGQRGGTEATAGILAMVAALEERLAALATFDRVAAERARDGLIEALRSAGLAVRVVGEGRARFWNTALLLMPRHASGRWIAQLDRRGFQVASGSACSTGKPGVSASLLACGVARTDAERALRLSSGPLTRPEDWRALTVAIRESAEALEDEPGAPSPLVYV